MNFEVTIAGELYICKVISFYAGEPVMVGGPPAQCFPAESGELEFELYSDGRRATQLESELTNSDRDMICEEFLKNIGN